MAHLIGYARVSTSEQDAALQRDALEAAGCYRVFVDVASGARADRPQLAAALDHLRPGDSLVVWRLDRLGRSLRHLLDTLTELDGRGVGFRSLQESLDTTTAGGRLVFHVFGALAEFERELIRDRTLAGLEAARSRGRRGGRPPRMTPAKLRQARAMKATGTSVTEIANVLDVSRGTVYRHLDQDVVAGYSVAQRPPAGEGPIWYGGGHLARDLTLPRLRTLWADTPDGASAAAAEWGAARRGGRPVATGREVDEPDPVLWERHTAEVAELRERLRSVPVEDRATWAHVARETAGAFAAWSLQVEATPGPLAATADALARSAQLRAHEARAPRTPLPSVKGAALLLASVSHGGTGTVAQAVLLRQLANTAKALHDAHAAAGDAQRAAQIAQTVRTQLATVGAALPAAPAAAADARADVAARVARAGQAPLRQPGSPLPTDLQAQHARADAGRPAHRTGDRDAER